MSTRLKTALLPFSISGTGVEVVVHNFFPDVPINGRVRRIVIREEAGGGATAGTFYLMTFGHVTSTAPSTEPQERFILVTASVPLTASASATSLDSPVTAEPTFHETLALVADVTAGAGAWTISGWLDVER